MSTPRPDALAQWIRSLTPTAAPDSRCDEELLRLFVRDQDAAAFTTLLLRHGPMVLGVCQRILRDPHAAEDAFQAVFLLLARKASVIRDPPALANWLYGVASRAALQARRMIVPPVEEPDDRPGREREPPEEAAGREILRFLDEEIDCLPTNYRQAIVLCCLEGRTHSEAARQLGCPLGTLASWLSRARERLRVCLGRRGLDLSGALLSTVLLADKLSAAVPLALTQAAFTHTAALLGARTSAIPSRLLKLYEEVSRAMTRTKFRYVTVIVVGLIAVGVGGIGLWAFPQKDGPMTTQSKPDKGTVGQAPLAPKKEGVPGNATITSQEKYPSFSIIVLQGVGKVVVKQTGRDMVLVKEKEGFVLLRNPRIGKGTLSLGLDAQPGLAVPGLGAPGSGVPGIELPGAGFPGVGALPQIEYSVEVKDLKGLHLAGTGSIEASSVKSSRLVISAGGMGEVTITGTADVLELTLQGSANFKGEGLKTKRATVRHTGFGNAFLAVSQMLDATVGGIGSVGYIGTPTVRRTITGVGSVRRIR